MMKEQIITFIREIISDKGHNLNQEINESTNLRDDLGLSSFDLATLTVMIEDKYGVDVFEDGIILTFGEIIERIKNKI